MLSAMDDETQEEAAALANARQRKPDKEPFDAAFMAAVAASAIMFAFAVLSSWLGQMFAWLLTAGLAGAVMYFDCREKWRLHRRAHEDALAFLERVKNA